MGGWGGGWVGAWMDGGMGGGMDGWRGWMDGGDGWFVALDKVDIHMHDKVGITCIKGMIKVDIKGM